MTMEDWMPTLMAWIGEDDLKEQLLDGKLLDRLTACRNLIPWR